MFDLVAIRPSTGWLPWLRRCQVRLRATEATTFDFISHERDWLGAYFARRIPIQFAPGDIVDLTLSERKLAELKSRQFAQEALAHLPAFQEVLRRRSGRSWWRVSFYGD